MPNLHNKRSFIFIPPNDQGSPQHLCYGIHAFECIMRKKRITTIDVLGFPVDESKPGIWLSAEYTSEEMMKKGYIGPIGLEKCVERLAAEWWKRVYAQVGLSCPEGAD